MNKIIPPEMYFYFCNGKVAKSVSEMLVILKNIPENEFSQHVNSEKNDIANWINGVYQRPDIAEMLNKKRSLKATIGILKTSYAKHEKEQKKARKRIEIALKKEHKAKAREKKPKVSLFKKKVKQH
ncbi:MAG: hypothetical protein V1659_00480 [Candidatus Woesearchaeota archaeon]